MRRWRRLVCGPKLSMHTCASGVRGTGSATEAPSSAVARASSVSGRGRVLAVGYTLLFLLGQRMRVLFDLLL
jgi:hypothetical protein